MSYERGLVEIAEGVFAYLQPDGGWGWSNAGLVKGDGDSLLVDTLFDLKLTRDMLDEMAPVIAGNAISTLVNTHANGDHCYGNQLVTGADVITSVASAAEMEELPPALLAAMMEADFGEVTNDYLQRSFGAFDFTGIRAPVPTTTFSGEMALEIGGRAAQLIEVGPAHTAGDVLVHLRNDSVVFTGDILFIEGTPLVWNGPFQNWIDACQRIIHMDCDVIVPGHGPITDAAGVKAVAGYLSYVKAEATKRYEAGMAWIDAAKDIELGHYASLLDPERIVINVDSVYRELDPQRPQTNVIELFTQMAHY